MLSRYRRGGEGRDRGVILRWQISLGRIFCWIVGVVRLSLDVFFSFGDERKEVDT